MDKLILASNSPRRRALLEQIGIDFTVDASDVDEVTTATDPVEYVMDLSKMKAQAAACHHDGSWVLGADTVVYYDGELLGKPANAKEAFDMLCMLSGRKHEVITGVTLIKNTGRIKRMIQFAENTSVWMYEHHRDIIKAYVETGEPMDKAGAYGIQGRGAILVERIEGDYNNVVGLPVAKLYKRLAEEKII